MSKLDQLRKKAEQLIAHTSSLGKGKFDGAEIQELLHELEIHQVELQMQNEELRQAQEALEKMLDNYSHLYHNAPVGYMTMDSKGMILKANQTMANMLNTDHTRMKGQALADFIVPDDLPLYYGAYKGFAKNPTGKSIECRMRPKGGGEFYALLKGQAAGPEPPLTGYNVEDPLLVTVNDISSRKLLEDQLREHSRTQAVLFREVNHRVKNNLTAIISMLHIEEDGIREKGSQECADVLRSLTSRVEGLAAVHSLLSTSGWKPLEIQSICEIIIKTTIKWNPASAQLTWQVTPSPVKVDSSRAHHLALVFNELVTNTIKHAMPFEKNCHIATSIDIQENDVVIKFRDSGPGYPEDIVNGDHSRFNTGMQLIHGIVTQSLGGSLEFTNDHGALATIHLHFIDPKNMSLKE